VISVRRSRNFMRPRAHTKAQPPASRASSPSRYLIARPGRQGTSRRAHTPPNSLHVGAVEIRARLPSRLHTSQTCPEARRHCGLPFVGGQRKSKALSSRKGLSTRRSWLSILVSLHRRRAQALVQFVCVCGPGARDGGPAGIPSLASEQCGVKALPPGLVDTWLPWRARAKYKTK